MVSQRRGNAPPRYHSRRDHIAALDVQIATLRRGERGEMRALRLKIETMAQHIQALTLLTIEQRRRIASFEGSQPSVRGVIGTVGRPVYVLYVNNLSEDNIAAIDSKLRAHKVFRYMVTNLSKETAAS